MTIGTQHPLPASQAQFCLLEAGLARKTRLSPRLSSGLTRGPLCQPVSDELHADKGPRVKPEGSPVQGQPQGHCRESGSLGLLRKKSAILATAVPGPILP